MRISGSTTVCGIVGDPVAHSLSPAMHNAAIEALGLDFVYVPFRLPRGATAAGAAAVRNLGIRGLNVTVPHKSDIMSCLDWIDPPAMRIGAVNTIVNEDGFLRGYNTDAPGFVRGLESQGVEVAGKQVVVLGAGGAARAVIFSLVDCGARVTVLNRNTDRAATLAGDASDACRLPVAHGPLTEAALDSYVAGAALLVNTTSVGMHPGVAESPCPRGYLRPDLVVCDIIYNPVETALLREAAESGAATVNGVEMLVQQGALALELWTGVAAPIDLMRSAVRRELGYGAP